MNMDSATIWAISGATVAVITAIGSAAAVVIKAIYSAKHEMMEASADRQRVNTVKLDELHTNVEDTKATVAAVLAQR